MNRDTSYSFGIIYAPSGTTIALPKSKDDCYQSAVVLQTDHYIDQTFYAPGTFEIESKTEFSGIAVRTQVDANDPDEVKYVNSLQDQIVVTLPKGITAREYQPREWDQQSLTALRAAYQQEASALPNLKGTSGAHGTLDPHVQRLDVSVAFGLQLPEHAMYIYRDYGLKGNECYMATYTSPGFRDKSFFSFTIDGADKYIHDEKSTLNSRVIKDNPDGTFTIYYGPESVCGKQANWLNTPGDNWYLGIRIYRPVDEILKNGYEPGMPTLVKR